MEIERKYLPDKLPEDLSRYPSKEMEQAYLCVAPVVRVRHEGDEYVLTYKGKGMMIREEVNLPLTAASYAHLLAKADGRIIKKTRYRVPIKDGLTAEVDVFHEPREGLVLIEVEFPSKEAAFAFEPPEWFGKEVTNDPSYHNSHMALKA